MPLAVISPPAYEPVSLVRIKRHLRLDHSEDDDYLLELLSAATLHIEANIGQYLITRTVRQYVDNVPGSRSICLEACPVKSIIEVRGYDIDGNPNIINTENYQLDTRINPAALILNTNINFNAFINGLEIDLVSGHGEAEPDIPSNITRALLVLITHWYEFRGALVPGEETALIPTDLEALIAPFKKVRL